MRARYGRLDSGMFGRRARADNDDSACGGAMRMRIGELVTYAGRRYVVRGLDPMGVPDRRADLEDVETGARLRVRIAELERA
ncbi:MAG: hypothetical protein ACRDNB_09680 [Gaiellaceae bacterium]